MPGTNAHRRRRGFRLLLFAGSLITALMLAAAVPLLLFSAGSASRPAVLILTGPDMAEEARRFLDRNPLPAEAVAVFEGEAPAADEELITVATLSFHRRPSAVDTAVDTAADPSSHPPASPAPEGTGELVLSREYLVPQVPLSDMRRSVSADAALEMDPVPMSAVHLPYKALAVDGRYPGDPDYPLYRRSLVRFEPVDRKELPDRFRGEGSVSAALAAWFAQAEKNTPPPKPPERIRIGGVGDLMVARGVQEMLIGKGAAGRKKVFGDTLPLLRDQDLLLGNLEGAVTARGTPTPKSYNFRFRPEVLPELKAAGFDYLSLTNNHCWDYGRSGFLDTLSHFKRYEVPTSGAGRSPEEARRPTEFHLSGRTVRVLSVAAYPQEKNGFDGRTQASVTSDRPGILFSGPEALEAVRSFSGDDSIDVVMVHGGQEWQDRPTAEQQRFYRSLVDAGANLVLGSHPHVLQGLESSSDGLIAYSLGNFVFPGMYVIPRAEETLLLSVVFYGDRPLYVEAYPIRISHRVLTRAEESGILDRFEGLTEELNG